MCIYTPKITKLNRLPIIIIIIIISTINEYISSTQFKKFSNALPLHRQASVSNSKSGHNPLYDFELEARPADRAGHSVHVKLLSGTEPD